MSTFSHDAIDAVPRSAAKDLRRITVRVTPDLRKRFYHQAIQEDKKLNHLAVTALEEYLRRKASASPGSTKHHQDGGKSPDPVNA